MLDTKSLSSATIADAATSIRNGEITAVELTEAFLERVRLLDPKLNSFITITGERALRDAKRIDKNIKEGKRKGLLQGVPIALKDDNTTAGIRTTWGAKIYSDHIPKYDAAVVSRLKKHGAIILGKLNLHELTWGATSENPHFGAVRNPWDVERVPGGSGGGSGAAVAASLCLGSLGTDAGGSNRSPASFCGIVGLKPTYGRVSLHGIKNLSWSLESIGPMTKTVRDAAIMLEAVAGYDSGDPISARVALPRSFEAGADISKLKIGVIKEFSSSDFLDKEVRSAFRTSLGVLESCGALVEEISIPWMKYSFHVAVAIILAEGTSAIWPEVRDRRTELGSDVRALLEEGNFVSALDYLRALRIRSKQIKEVKKLLKAYDLFVTPTTPHPATKIGQQKIVLQSGRKVDVGESIPQFTAVFNVLGLPAINVPCGFSSSGLPIGLQIAGGYFEEAKVLKAAAAYESRTDWHLRHPTLA